MAIDGQLGALRGAILTEAQRELWRYVSRSANVGAGGSFSEVAGLLGLDEADARRLGEVHFLASGEVSALLSEHVPDVFRRIARTTSREARVEAGVRGPIDWPATVAARAAGGWAAPVYAFDEPAASEDVAANRVLKATLELIVSLASQVAGDDAVPAAEGGRGWLDLARSAGRRAAEHLRSPLLARVSSPRHVSEHDVRAAEADRNRAYDGVVAAHRLHERLVERPDADALLEMMRERLFEPAKDARLYEIWVLAHVARALETLCGAPLELPLLGRNHGDPVYRFRTPGDEPVGVFFQTVPPRLRGASRYRAIFEAYEMDVSSRMPDLVIEVGSGLGVRRLLIEVKASRDAGYIADGVYKLLGYCADFDAALRPLADSGPRGLLVILEGAAARPGIPRAGHVVRIATRYSLERELAEALAPLAGVRVALAATR